MASEHGAFELSSRFRRGRRAEVVLPDGSRHTVRPGRHTFSGAPARDSDSGQHRDSGSGSGIDTDAVTR